MRKLLLHNLGLKLASLALAFVLWFLVVQIDDPIDSVTFSNVNIKLINTELLDQQNKVYEVLDDTDIARVTVHAPKSVIGQIRKTDIVAEADVSKLTDINTVAVKYYVENISVDEIEGTRDIVNLNVEEKSSKWVPLVSNTVGEVADGYIISSTALDQTSIEVTGPESVVSEVKYAAVDMGVTGATTSISANIDIHLFDTEDKEVIGDNLKKNVNYAYMTVEVLATKEIPVKVEYQGVPEEGYLATGVADSSLSSVTIAGKPAAIAAVNMVTVPAERMDITGANDSLVETVNLKEYLPDNVKWADKNFSGKVTATVYVEPIMYADLDIPVENIRIVNVPAEFRAEFPEDIISYELTISGLAQNVNMIKAEQVAGMVDVTAYMNAAGIENMKEGTYEIPVVFNLSGDITVEAEVIIPIKLIVPEEE